MPGRWVGGGGVAICDLYLHIFHLQVAMLGKNLSHLTSGGGEDGEQIFSTFLTEIFAQILKIFIWQAVFLQDI